MKMTLLFLFSIETKSIISEKLNQLSAIDITEELEKRPFSSSTAQFSDVDLEINSISFIVYRFIYSFYRIVKYLNQLQLYSIIDQYHR